MRFNKLMSLVLVLAATSFGALTAQAEMKLAVVDVDRAVAGSEAAQKLLRQLQEEFRQKPLSFCRKCKKTLM